MFGRKKEEPKEEKPRSETTRLFWMYDPRIQAEEERQKIEHEIDELYDNGGRWSRRAAAAVIFKVGASSYFDEILVGKPIYKLSFYYLFIV